MPLQVIKGARETAVESNAREVPADREMLRRDAPASAESGDNLHFSAREHEEFEGVRNPTHRVYVSNPITITTDGEREGYRKGC